MCQNSINLFFCILVVKPIYFTTTIVEERLTPEQTTAQPKTSITDAEDEDSGSVIVYDSNLDHQHSSIWNFAKRCFGPYEVGQVHENGTYWLRKLDGTLLRTLIAG